MGRGVKPIQINTVALNNPGLVFWDYTPGYQSVPILLIEKYKVKIRGFKNQTQQG
jgi:hypothetical protein